MTTTEIITFLEANPGAIAAEIGTDNNTLKALEAEGKITNIGNRKTGKRGRPPIEWVAGKVTVEKREEIIEEKPKPVKAAPTLAPAPSHLDEETSNKIDYLDRQISGTRSDGTPLRDEGDVKYLIGVRKEIITRFNNDHKNSDAAKAVLDEIANDDDAEEAIAA